MREPLVTKSNKQREKDGGGKTRQEREGGQKGAKEKEGRKQ